ncbi:MAG: hypothetical protein HKN07_16135 [Acidimicrobiia bacterium]|nr:hypothetical protein [Acidimicrobiia bacterium]
MPSAAIVTLVIAAVLILALAVYLLRVIVSLRSIINLLGKITFGVRAIAHQTEPVNGLVGDIGAEAMAIDRALKGLIAAKVVERQEAS